MQKIKGNMYHFFEQATPPFLFRGIKKSRLYAWAVSRVFRKDSVGHGQEFVITQGDLAGITLKLSGAGGWQQDMIQGVYDQELFERIKQESFGGAVVYDIGAHIGYHSLAFARLVGEKGCVYAFEPNPANNKRTEEMLAANPELAPRITIQALALSDKAGSASFLSTSDVEGGTSTGGFITEAETIWKPEVFIEKTGFKASHVPTDTIDHLVKSGQVLPPDLLKIDVEGAEHLVLAGASETIRKHKPAIVVEYHSVVCAHLCTSALRDHGYALEVLKQEDDGRLLVFAYSQS